MQRDGVAGAVAPREKSLAADCAADRHGAQASRHLAEGHREKLAFDLPLSACLVLLRPMQQCALERGNSNGRITKIRALRERRGEREAIFISGDVGRR